MDKEIELTHIIKRDGRIVPFDRTRIERAVEKALIATNKEIRNIPVIIADKVIEELKKKKAEDRNFVPTVEGVQDLVEKALMEQGLYETAKAYILYRDWRARLRKRNIFQKRLNLKPYEYPELIDYVDAIRHSYWLHTEFNFTSDVQDFKVKTNEIERNAIKNSSLAIAQIKLMVKQFWGDIYKKLPKPEIAAVGYTFAESEVRHMDAYSHLLKILNLESEFEKINEIRPLKERYLYLEKAKQLALSEENKEFSKAILLFSIFVEHVSLFSQFLVIMSFNKYKNMFKGTSNAVEATSKEEQIHGLFGIELINIIKQENPEWFDENYIKSITDFCKEFYQSEENLIDWILEKGDLEFLSKYTIKEFIKNRINNDLEMVGFPKIFEVDEKAIKETNWFEEEVITTKHTDFFFKRSINYSRRQFSITPDDIF
jgi:ribonucleoside-diphosphate reductase beta chain